MKRGGFGRRGVGVGRICFEVEGVGRGGLAVKARVLVEAGRGGRRDGRSGGGRRGGGCGGI